MFLHYLKNDYQNCIYYFWMKMTLLFGWKTEHCCYLKTITTYFQKEKSTTNQRTTSFHNFFQEETRTTFAQSVSPCVKQIGVFLQALNPSDLELTIQGFRFNMSWTSLYLLIFLFLISCDQCCLLTWPVAHHRHHCKPAVKSITGWHPRASWEMYWIADTL